MKTIFWVCKVEEIDLVTEVSIFNKLSTEKKPTVHFNPAIWFSNEFDALTWIQENEGSWTIVKVFDNE